MLERHENERSFLRNLHERYYGKKKRREKRKEEKQKQLWLFESIRKKFNNQGD